MTIATLNKVTIPVVRAKADKAVNPDAAAIWKTRGSKAVQAVAANKANKAPHQIAAASRANKASKVNRVKKDNKVSKVRKAKSLLDGIVHR